MEKPRFIDSITDWFMIGAALVLFTVEVFAMFHKIPFITNEFVEISVQQVWVPAVMGILMGHFYPVPFLRGEGSPVNLVMIMTGCIVGYICWYAETSPELAMKVVDILADYLYLIFLGGYLLGSRYFPRPRNKHE